MPNHSAPSGHAAPSNQAGPTPWMTGVVLSVLSGIFTILVMLSFYSVIASFNAGVGVVVVLVAVAGVAPTVWVLRSRPVWRWACAGVAIGAAVGGIGVIIAGISAI